MTFDSSQNKNQTKQQPQQKKKSKKINNGKTFNQLNRNS